MKAKTKTTAEKPKPDCVTLLGGMLAGLCMSADVKDVREAVQWWARNHKGWMHFAAFAAAQQAHLDAFGAEAKAAKE